MNRTLVFLNVLIFALQIGNSWVDLLAIKTFSFVPARLFHAHDFGISYISASSTLLTSLFLHGGFLHLLGNMLYLWIFGRSVEERFGHSGYLVFYLASGVLGNLTHAFAFPLSEVPTIGASGCIAGVLGAFLVLFPRARVITLFPLIVYWGLAEIPALVFLPVWFALQFLNGWMSVSATPAVQEMAGVAWWAHIGGFVFGLLVGLWWREYRGVPDVSTDR